MDSTSPAPEKVQPSILVPHARLHPSALNPRSRFDEAALKELAASMAPPVGIIEPLVVRPHPTKHNGDYEIIAGERRWRAAKIATLADVPVIVRVLNDKQVLDIQLIENDQRADIHPLDKARGFQKRLQLEPGLKPKDLAKTLGLSERSVQNTLRYLRLTPKIQAAFVDGKFTAGHADILIRLKPEDQERAFKEGLFERHSFDDGDSEARDLRSVRVFDDWVRNNVRLNLDAAGREEIQERFPELAAVLTDPAKPTLLELVDNYYVPKGSAALNNDRWHAVKKGETCAFQARGVIIVGRNQGDVLTVCTGVGKCKKHFPYSIHDEDDDTGGRRPIKRSPGELRKMQQDRLWSKVKKTAMAEAIKATPTTLTAGVRKVLAYGIESWHYRGQDLSIPDLVKMVLERKAFLLDRQTFASRIAKPLGVDLAKLEKAAAPTKPKKAAAPKKAAKKAARPAKAGPAKGKGKKVAGGRKKR